MQKKKKDTHKFSAGKKWGKKKDTHKFSAGKKWVSFFVHLSPILYPFLMENWNVNATKKKKKDANFTFE